MRALVALVPQFPPTFVFWGGTVGTLATLPCGGLEGTVVNACTLIVTPELRKVVCPRSPGSMPDRTSFQACNKLWSMEEAIYREATLLSPGLRLRSHCELRVRQVTRKGAWDRVT